MNRRENVAATLACGLAEEVVRTFGEVRLRVFGTSMVPSILPGDLISIQRAAASEISSGEIVLYTREGRLFAHRVVGRAGSAGQPFAAQGESLLITRGDRLRYNDPPVSSSELLGRVISIGRGDRQLEPLPRAIGSNHPLIRLLQSSDRATYLYLRLASLWRTLFPRRAECRA
jgi:signal peptidase I